ncbi:hypothetical protein S40285_05752 [Stachybotrys chlorohalonatus IBT 40285]|uniref:Uncharacterized protein n=1 Tax=Stachybotrys chlorohalonatus (strain IBT 40285) TaxID=1283841 RepID=A0A084QSM8_STAC4|nr:hypothetical protein S40285_05752 [Stachybotrys chlorohalonata IBT 40285]
MSSSRYTFRTLSIYGVAALWGLMAVNGTLGLLVQTAWYRVYPTGTTHNFAWTGIWPVDFQIGLLVSFFYSLFAVAELPDDGPFLLGLDLLLALAVFNLMTLVEDRRNRKTGSLRVPVWWQSLWNFFGAACVLPVYIGMYVEKRARTSPGRVPAPQAQALVFSALWLLTLSLPTLLPGLLLSSPYRIQAGVVMWLAGPFTLGPFQDIVAYSLSGHSATRGLGFRNPVKAAYTILGVASALVHVAVVLGALVDSHTSVSRIYVPQHARLVPGTQTALIEGAMLFTQYDYIGITLTTLAAGLFLLRRRAGNKKVVRSQGNTSSGMGTMAGLTALFGPGAGMAWLLCKKEDELSAT